MGRVTVFSDLKGLTMRTSSLALAAAASLALALTACSSGDADTGDGDASSAAGSSDVALVKDGKLTVCTNVPYEPFQYEVDGKIVGFDISITQEVADDLGAELEVVAIGFDGIQSGAALDAGTCDIVASAITINEEREKNLDFSDPYFDADQAVLVAEDSTVADEDDLADITVGVMQATTGADWVKGLGITPTEFEDLGLQVVALQNGQIDAAVNDIAALGPFTTDGLKVAFTVPTGEQYGFGVKTGNTALLEAVNGTLERINTDGTYDELYTEFIGTQG